MGAFGVILRSLHCMGLYIQLSASLRQAGSDDVENHISSNGKICGSIRFYTRRFTGLRFVTGVI